MRSEYHTQLAKMSFDKIFDLTAAYSVFFLYVRICMIIFLFSRIRSGVFVRLGHSMRLLELEFSVKYLCSRTVFGSRLERFSPCRIRSAPGRDRVRGLSETSEKCAIVCISGGIRPSHCRILAYAELERKKLFSSWHYFQNGFIFRPNHTFFMVTTRSVWPVLTYECCVVAFRYRISRLNTFSRAFVVFEGGRSQPNDIIIPGVRADSSS